LGKACFVCDKKLGFVHEPFGKYTLGVEHREIPKGFKDDSALCKDCLESQPKIKGVIIQREEPKKEPKPTRTKSGKAIPSNPSLLIWLLPILLGCIGGLIMYLVLKDEDIDRAKLGLYVGIAITICSGIVAVIIWLTSLL